MLQRRQDFSHAASEAKLVLEEFQKEFGENTGIGLYNELHELIGERDKNCLPFVNMCLRTWLVRLRDNPDVYADKYVFEFDQWVTEKMTQPVTHQHGEKTSYELMVAVFGSSEIEKETSNAGQTPTTTAAKANERTSKLQRIGEEVKKKLLESHQLQDRKSSITAANKEITAAVEQSKECGLNHHAIRRCKEASQQIEDLLFSAGEAERIVTTLRYFRDRNAVQELEKVRNAIDASTFNATQTKQVRLQSVLMDGLRTFLAIFHRPHEENDKGGGR